MAILGAYTYFGEEEIIDRIRKRIYEARVVSAEAETMCISKRSLSIFLAYLDITYKLKNNLEKKKSWRQLYLE